MYSLLQVGDWEIGETAQMCCAMTHQDMQCAEQITGMGSGFTARLHVDGPSGPTIFSTLVSNACRLACCANCEQTLDTHFAQLTGITSDAAVLPLLRCNVRSAELRFVTKRASCMHMR